MDRPEIRSDKTRESPILLEDLIQQLGIFAAESAVDLVVSAHERRNMALFDGCLEGGKIDFAQRALVNDGAN